MAALLTVRFLAELGMLTCLAWGGWQHGQGLFGSLSFALILPVTAAVVWGQWISPRAPRRLDDPMRLGVEVALFLAAVFVVGGVEPSPQSMLFGFAVGAAFLVSLPARGKEPVPPAGG